MENMFFKKYTHTHKYRQINIYTDKDENISLLKDKLCHRQLKREFESWKTDFRKLSTTEQIEIRIQIILKGNQ